jgi:hypothetical protein
MHNPNVFRQWMRAGTDIRKLNPSGVYLKHLSLRTIDRSYASVGDHPDYNWIHANHPEWILRNASGNTVSLFLPTEESLDFGNPAYLDWVFGTWFPLSYFDSTDRDVNLQTWYVHDNGNFLRQNINCGPSDAVCQKYTTDAGVQTAWKTLFDKFHQYYPNKKILVSTGTLSYMSPSAQLPWMKDVLAHADGYFSEGLTNDHVYWNSQPNADKRNALQAELQLADWLAANGKYFFPNLGMADGTQPTQAQTNYGYAFFNLLRRGSLQSYSQVMKDSSGNWQPRIYPEMQLALGKPLENRQVIATNVYRRIFEQAIAYVNLSDSQVSINLPSGTYKNSLGKVVSSPLTLSSFSGLTVYHSMPIAPTNLRATAVSRGQVNLSWTDNSNNEAGFKIGRSINGVDFTSLPLVDANVTSYKDMTVHGSTKYYYRIRAYNNFGYSALSNVASLTTPP